MRKLLIVLTLCALFIDVEGQTISITQARQNVTEFLNARSDGSHVKGKRTSQHELVLAYTAVDNDGDADYYVFNDSDGGFVIAGGDEIAECILAYSDEGSFKITELPESFRYWLSEYQRQIAYAKENRDIVPARADTKNRVDISILTKTKWDQSSPYNSDCPKIKGKSTYTGCVATAMAQVMKFHSWPEKGRGSHSYFDPDSQSDLYSDFSQHTYDWTNMANMYNTASRPVQKEAVALLMSDCGISVETGYGTNGSGAWTENVTYALVNFFGYDKGATQIMRDYTSASEWDEIIYNELANNRPVIFSGTDKSYQNGHCFICDGYNSTTQKYHFNWGWGGQGNCYCSLSAVQIDRSNDFSYFQDIITGIQPPRDDTKTPVYILAYDGGLNLSENKGENGITYTAKYIYEEFGRQITNIVYNHTNRDIDVIFAVKYTHAATGESFITSAKDIEANKVSFKAMYPVVDPSNPAGVKTITVKDAILPDMPAGEYRVTIVAKDYLDKDYDDISLWKEVLTYEGNDNFVTLNYIPTDIPKTYAITHDTTERYDITGLRSNPSVQGVIIENGRKYLKSSAVR
ncbi:MAG: C10 family peptidase [Bacteroidaceae bacterium]|nr:C10 family peptidase [Bacteroidaceae bacterium]